MYVLLYEMQILSKTPKRVDLYIQKIKAKGLFEHESKSACNKQ